MPDAALNLPIIGQPDSTEEPKVRQALADIQAIVNDLDVANLSASAAAILGTGSNGRGKSIIATPESRTNTAYGVMPTPDRVSGITLPTDGLICVAFAGLWKTVGAGGTFAQVFLNGTGVQEWSQAAQALQPAAATDGAGSIAGYYPLVSHGSGLVTPVSAGVVDWASAPTTGMLVGMQGFAESSANMTGQTRSYGGPMFIYAAAGTYDVSIQFKNTGGGAVNVKERKMWVWTMGF